MITFRDLSQTSTADLLTCCNHAFSDYIVPLQFSLKQLETKFQTENFNPTLSVGAFEEGSLVGYIFHCVRTMNGKKTVYNAGTGVIPSHRGHGLTVRMYEHALPKLRKEQVEHLLLEVIVGNHAAIKSYEKVGFNVARTLDCFKGEITLGKPNQAVQLEETTLSNLREHLPLGDLTPSWQNDLATIDQLRSSLTFITARINEELTGYCIFNTTSSRLMHITVKDIWRRKGLGNALLGYIRDVYTPTISIINVDHSAEETTAFLQQRGLEKTISQLEMSMAL